MTELDPPHIGIVCHASCGGSTRVALDLGECLASRGRQVHLFSRHRPYGWKAESGLAPHFAFNESGAGFDPSLLHTEWSETELSRLVTEILAVCRDPGLDLLHIHYLVPFARLAPMLRARLGLRCPALIGTLHGTDVSIFGRREDTAGWLREALGAFDVLTTVSDSHAKLAKHLFGLRHRPITISNFLPPGRFGSRLGSPAVPGGRPARIVHISNLRPVKNVAALCEVYSHIRQNIDAELWIVGEGKGGGDIAHAARAGGWLGEVSFFGALESSREILEQCDLMVITSREESFSLLVLEAMAAGVPTAGFAVGGLPEVVGRSGAAVLKPFGQCMELALEAVEIIRDRERYARMSRAGFERAAEFSDTAIVPLYERLYRDTLGALGRCARGPGRSRGLEAAS